MSAQRALPATIGRFRIGGVLGTGAFSAVYLAVDDRIGSEVAVKLLADHHSLDPDIRERFIAEARLLRRLTSPHVVRLYELDETATHQPFHVLEYVAGGNLAGHRRDRLAEGAVVTAADLAHVAADLTAALTVLHAERIVHRDLAPKNLLVRPAADPDVDGAAALREVPGTNRNGVLRPGEQLVLADLGISKDLADSSGFTAAAGTLGYAAPEQRTVGTVDERVDVYAAAAVLAWMITGVHPTDHRPDAVVAAGFSPQLAAVIDAGLAHDPDARPQTIERWHAAVVAALGGAAPAGRTTIARPSRAPSAATAPPTGRSWRAGVAALALTVAAASAGIAIDRALDDDGDRPAVTVEHLDDGQVRVAQTVGDVTAAFTAPATIRPGETVRVTGAVEGTDDWMWIIPSARTAGTQRIDLTAPANGSIDLRLVAIGADGATAEAAYTFTVTTDS